ncbi:MAG: hypothetical protein HYU36_12355 [Planctomycetes bacterium]|nr:hypothetical protein [Planctomycetota bacterium]
MEALRRGYALEHGLACQLQEHARMAVYQEFRARVQDLAQRHETNAGILLTKIREMGESTPAFPSSPQRGRNHWERMSFDLEEVKNLASAYLEMSGRIDRGDVRELLERLRADAEASEGDLFHLVARADPYAVD